MPDRPSILFIHTDSHDGRVMGCMGHPSMRKADGSSLTPNMDSLAARGTLFRNAYSNNPICCPSRSSMMSGTWTHHCEAWNNYKGLADGRQTLLDPFERSGYRVGVYGKTDWTSGNHTVRARVTAWTRSAWIPRPSYRMGGPVVLDDARERVHERDWTDVDSACAWLREAPSGGDGPFMQYVGIRSPHPEFYTSRHWYDQVDPEAIEIPLPSDADDHPALQYQRLNKNWLHGLDEDTVRHVRRIYFAQVAEVDAMLGQLMGELDTAGLTDSTHIVFSSDHGELAMEHDQFYKMCHYEASTRVPLIVAGPGVGEGVATDDLASLVDLYPTFTDIAGIDPPDDLDGHSLLPELRGESSSRPDWVLSEYHDTSMPTGTFMLRQGDWKVVRYVGLAPHLFDLANDPDELHDRAAECPDVLSRLDGILDGVVDQAEVDARVKAYDRQAFGAWRKERIAAGDYDREMGHIYSGWDDQDPADADPWRPEDEARIEAWLAGDVGG